MGKKHEQLRRTTIARGLPLRNLSPDFNVEQARSIAPPTFYNYLLILSTLWVQMTVEDCCVGLVSKPLWAPWGHAFELLWRGDVFW